MKKVQIGGYLAPHIEVLPVSSEEVLCDSGYVDDYDVVDPWDGVDSAPSYEY